jgi:hypothetical protein
MIRRAPRWKRLLRAPRCFCRWYALTRRSQAVPRLDAALLAARLAWALVKG